MKQLILPLLILVFLSGCASTYVQQYERVPTVSSDLYPVQMTRAEYYEEMAKGYAKDNQPQKAIDYFRISLLHNPKRISAALALSDSYRSMKMDHLAIFELSEILRVQPRNREALLRLADLYLSTKIYSKAKEAFTMLLKIDDNYDEARWSLYYICKLERNYQEAEQAINNIVMTNENRAELNFEKAFIAKHFNRFDEYSRLISEAYALNPHDRKTVLEMKDHYLKVFKFESAVKVLQNYSETHDFDMEISEGITYVAVRAENYDVAIIELDKQRIWSLETAAIDMKKGHVYFLAGDLALAETEYQKAINRKSNLDEARFYLAQIYLYQNRLTEARTVLTNLRASSDYYAEAQVRLAFFEKENNEPDLAMNRIRLAHNRRPDQLVIYKAYADFLIEAKRYVETVALLEKGIGFFPNDEDLRVKAAFVHYRLRNPRAFRKNIAKALELNPESAEVYSYMTELWYLKGKDPRDVEFFANKALQFKTKNKNIKPLLAWAILAQDRSTEAVALFEKFYEENPDQPFYAQALAKVYRDSDATIKGDAMKKLALRLQNQSGLRSGLILDSNNKSIDSNQPNASPVRLPASLENQQ